MTKAMNNFVIHTLKQEKTHSLPLTQTSSNLTSVNFESIGR